MPQVVIHEIPPESYFGGVAYNHIDDWIKGAVWTDLLSRKMLKRVKD